MSRSKANQIRTALTRAENADTEQDATEAIQNALSLADEAESLTGRDRERFIEGWQSWSS